MSGKTQKNHVESMTEQVKDVMDRAQEETSNLMNSLVQESEKLRDQTLKLTEETVNEAKEQIDEIHDRVEGVRGKAANTLDHLEQIFEERVSRALKRLGVPTRDDLQGIAQRLEEINKNIMVLADNRQAEEPDDLKLINGIGPVLEAKLNAAGIHYYRQMAKLTDADIEQLEAEIIQLSGRIRRDDWIGQAIDLHIKKYGEPL